MERRQLYIYAGIAVIVLVLLVVAIADYASWQSANARIDHYNKLQKELSQVHHVPVLGRHGRRRKGLDPGEPARIHGSAKPGDRHRGGFHQGAELFSRCWTRRTRRTSSSRACPTRSDDVLVYLGQYYEDNMTRVPGWMAIYQVNHSDHTVSGITSIVAENMAYDHYASELNPTIYQQLGVSRDTVLGFTQQTIDCSYLNATGEWLDVSEYCYSFRNTDVKTYLLVKTYVNAEHPASDRRGCLAAVLQQRHRRKLLSKATFLSAQRQWTILCHTNRFHLFPCWGSSTGSWVKNILQRKMPRTLSPRTSWPGTASSSRSSTSSRPARTAGTGSRSASTRSMRSGR